MERCQFLAWARGLEGLDRVLSNMVCLCLLGWREDEIQARTHLRSRFQHEHEIITLLISSSGCSSSPVLVVWGS